MNFLQSLTAKAAMPAKEEKSLTAKAAVDAKCKISEPTPGENAKTTPSMEWPQRACNWAGLQPGQSILTGAAAISPLGVVLADSGVESLLFSSRPPR